MRGSILAIAVLALATPPPVARAPAVAGAEVIDARGRVIGRARLLETPNDGVWIDLDVSGLEPGVHGFHIHETGRCEAPTFESAGGHYAPRGKAHGILNPEGAHAGDLLNLHVPESGAVRVEQLATRITLRPDAPATLFDDDGSALVIHARADDYRSQPAGDAGPRVACGVITRLDR